MTNLNDLHAASRRAAGASVPEKTKTTSTYDGAWISAPDARRFSMSTQEHIDLLVNHPSRIAAASDWRFVGPDAYAQYALRCDAMGWSVFAENQDGGRKPAVWKFADRRPAVITYPSQRRDRLAGPAMIINEVDLRASATDTPAHNVALTIGKSSSDVRVFDIDVLDEELSTALVNCAFEIFGPTPFVRVGRWPKRALIYRTVDKDVRDLRKLVFGFLGADGQPDLEKTNGAPKNRNMIEYLCFGVQF